MKAMLVLGLLASLVSGAAHAQLAKEDADENGVLNPIDFSYRFYLDEMNRFPERIGIICGHAYEVHKTGRHDEALMFLKECARRGNPPSMVLIAEIYDSGGGDIKRDPEKATQYVRQAAELGWSSAQYLYGVALIEGHGIPKDAAAGEEWLKKAAAQGDKDATALLATRAAIR